MRERRSPREVQLPYGAGGISIHFSLPLGLAVALAAVLSDVWGAFACIWVEGSWELFGVCNSAVQLPARVAVSLFLSLSFGCRQWWGLLLCFLQHLKLQVAQGDLK